MKYAIYDKAADGYLTKMELEVGYSENTQFECGYNEYITEAQLLDTLKEAADTIVRIESFKFMDKGRFVMHSFDDTLKDHYIISEAGKPTKVVDNITVNINGTIDVKYGTMASHWSASSLEYAINRMNTLQKAKDSRYTAWCDTFDIYKVINVIDEKSSTHYQFIKVTNKGLTEYAKDEVDPLNKRIEELEKANYELGERVAERGIVANRLLDENNSLKAKVEAIKKEARDWKTLYENANRDRNALTNVIDNIYDDLGSTDICKNLKETYNYVKDFSELHDIKIHNDDDDTRMPIYITANVEFRCIIDKIITIMESRELNQSVAFSVAEDIKFARNIANDIIPICEADDPFEITLKKFSQLYEAVNATYNTKNDPIIHAFCGILSIFSTMENDLEDFAVEIVGWKNKAQKAEKALEDQKKLNDANKATIAYLTIKKISKDKEVSDWKRRTEEAIRAYAKCNEALGEWKRKFRDEVKENHELRVARDCSAEIIYAIRNAVVNGDTNAFDCIESRMRHDPDFKSDPFMVGVRENVKDICSHEKINITNNELKNSEIAKLTKERDKALEQKEFYKRQANSVYGLTMPTRCCGKQVTADILSGKKIPVNKKKYDDLVEYVSNINLTYDTMFCMMDKPAYLPIMIEHLNDLTK